MIKYIYIHICHYQHDLERTFTGIHSLCHLYKIVGWISSYPAILCNCMTTQYHRNNLIAMTSLFNQERSEEGRPRCRECLLWIQKETVHVDFFEIHSSGFKSII